MIFIPEIITGKITKILPCLNIWWWSSLILSFHHSLASRCSEQGVAGCSPWCSRAIHLSEVYLGQMVVIEDKVNLYILPSTFDSGYNYYNLFAYFFLWGQKNKLDTTLTMFHFHLSDLYFSSASGNVNLWGFLCAVCKMHFLHNKIFAL